MSDELQLDAITCYTRIYEWLQHNARREAGQRLSSQVSLDTTLELVERLPSPDEAEGSDMDFVFIEVLTGQLESFLDSTDVHGSTLSSYAKHALNLRYGSQYPTDERLQESRSQSPLFAEFRYGA